jgi:hypothetical protein
MKSTLSLLLVMVAVLLSYSSATNNPVAALRSSSSSVIHSDENNYLRKQQQQQQKQQQRPQQLRRNMEDVSDYNEGNSTDNDDNGGYDSEVSDSSSYSTSSIKEDIGNLFSDINWDIIKVNSAVIGVFLGSAICVILLISLMLIFHCGNEEIIDDKDKNLINKEEKKKKKKRISFSSTRSFGTSSRSTSSKPKKMDNSEQNIRVCKSWSTTNSDSNDDSTCSDSGSVHSFLSAKISVTEDEVLVKSQSIDNLRKAMGGAMIELS